MSRFVSASLDYTRSFVMSYIYINRLIFIIETEYVYGAVRTVSLTLQRRSVSVLYKDSVRTAL
jgi:predicted permease